MALTPKGKVVCGTLADKISTINLSEGRETFMLQNYFRTLFLLEALESRAKTYQLEELNL